MVSIIYYIVCYYVAFKIQYVLNGQYYIFDCMQYMEYARLSVVCFTAYVVYSVY